MLRMVLSLAAIGAFSMPAAASVLDIAPDGQVTVHDRPAVYLGPDLAPQPILRPAPAAAPRTDAATIRAPLAAPRGEVAAALHSAAARHGVSPELVEAIAWRESRFDMTAVSPKGAIGVMQLMPATARALGVDPYALTSNIEGGVAYMASMLRRFDGDLVRALAAYNAGPGAVERHRGVPPYRETQAYVAAILGRLAAAGSN